MKKLSILYTVPLNPITVLNCPLSPSYLPSCFFSHPLSSYCPHSSSWTVKQCFVDCSRAWQRDIFLYLCYKTILPPLSWFAITSLLLSACSIGIFGGCRCVSSWLLAISPFLLRFSLTCYSWFRFLIRLCWSTGSRNSQAGESCLISWFCGFWGFCSCWLKYTFVRVIRRWWGFLKWDHFSDDFLPFLWIIIFFRIYRQLKASWNSCFSKWRHFTPKECPNVWCTWRVAFVFLTFRTLSFSFWTNCSKVCLNLTSDLISLNIRTHDKFSC